jgi:hypothetical protein
MPPSTSSVWPVTTTTGVAHEQRGWTDQFEEADPEFYFKMLSVLINRKCLALRSNSK